MNDKLLLEGGAHGHMNHVYDNGEMTFGELKQLLQAAADGKLRGTEKTDGQNLSISFNVQTGRAKAARNKTQLRARGLNPEELDDFFSNHPSQALRYSFVEALETFENAVKDLDNDTLTKIFGLNNEVYFNTEVMNPGNPDAPEGDPRRKGTTNVIPYDKKTLLIHGVGHFYFDPELTDEENQEVDVFENYERLESALRGKSTDDPSVFSVETHPQRKLAPEGLERLREVLQPTIDAINNLMQDIQVDDSDSIDHYVAQQIIPQIDQFGLTEDVNRMILQRVMKLGDYPGLPQITKGMPTEIKKEVSQFVKNFKYTDYTIDLQRILHDFSTSALEGFNSAFISDNQRQIAFLQDKIKTEIEAIERSSNERAKAELEKQMTKLKSIKGVNTPSEGFVFNWNGITYKFTGNFAPANQILGMRPFNRFGPIEPLNSAESPLKSETDPLKVAIFPGSFKPPHRGHVLAAEALAAEADVIYIFISAPQLQGVRKMKAIDSISADHAVQCWNAMIDKSPLKKKAKVLIGPDGVASSMMTAINFIQHEASPDNIFAAPMNSTVILGVGAKGSDADRYSEKVMQKSKEKRPDLKIVKKAVGPFQHSAEYLELLRQHPSIASMLNKGKGRLSPDEISDEERLEGKVADKHLYHASDMRDFIDLSAEDPIGLEFLKDFVPRPEDVFAVLGILGVNPADPASESDQVQEPELDDLEPENSYSLQEIIFEEAEKFFETFKRFKAPKGKKATGKFQKTMKSRLAKAHRTYLDMGRKDLTKHGGAFHRPRPKNISNAFLAEDEVQEISVAPNISGAPGAFSDVADDQNKKKDPEMNKKNNEKKLRRNIRFGIKKFLETKKLQNENLIASILEEHNLRVHLRNIILEESFSNINEIEDPSTDIHDNTGINTLKDLFKNTNVLSTLRNTYMTLTTSEDQKKSFRAHIIKWTQDTLAPVKLNDVRPDDKITEEVGVDIQGVEAEKFISANDGSQEPDVDKEEDELTTISGEDTTGRNKAERVYPKIEKSIVDYYAELDNPEDQEMFYDYLIANLKLYFDKWDSEMSAQPPEEPTNDQYDQAKTPEEPPGLSAV